MKLLARVKELGLSGWNMVAAILASVIGAAAVLVPLFISDDETSESSKATSPKALAVDFVENFHAGNWAAVWDALHPAEQALVSVDRYAECQSQNATALLISADVKGIHSTPLVPDPEQGGSAAESEQGGSAASALAAPGSGVANLGEDQATTPEYSGIDADAATIVTVDTDVRTESGRASNRIAVPMVPTEDGYKLVFSHEPQLAFERGECPPPKEL